jgi:hypothetical protein
MTRYADNRPKFYEYCYFWNEKNVGRMRCFYFLPEKSPDPDSKHRFWVHARAVLTEEILVLAIVRLKF